MEKSKCAVIQDDILAVKHALANGISFEALEGDDLKELLATLQAQRAEVIAGAKRSKAATSSGGGGGGGGEASAKLTSPKATPRRSAPKASSHGAQSARVEAPAAKDKPAGNASRRKQASTPTKRPAASPARAQAPHPQEEVVKKPRTMSTAERLRQLRKSIKVGNVVSVLMDIPVTGAWIRSWVRGEVTREMNRSGIFQIAFDHDKHGEGTVKLEPGEGADEDRWIHEQRLEIDHPVFFCGQGNDPPRGPDDTRPRGSWYLHQATQ